MPGKGCSHLLRIEWLPRLALYQNDMSPDPLSNFSNLPAEETQAPGNERIALLQEIAEHGLSSREA